MQSQREAEAFVLALARQPLAHRTPCNQGVAKAGSVKHMGSCGQVGCCAEWQHRDQLGESKQTCSVAR